MNSENRDILVYSKNTIREGLVANKVKALYVLRRQASDPLVKLAKENAVNVIFTDEGELTKMVHNPGHQGFVAKVSSFEEVSLETIISICKQKSDPLLLILDGIEDPHNLGAILRSADAFGVDGVLIKNKGEVSLNSTVAKVSTGAIFHVKVATVNNLSRAIQILKRNQFWIVASDGEAKIDYDEVDYSGPMALVVGSEGFGISRLVLENSDFIVKIPMVGHVNSLNASVATALMLSMASHLRKIKK